jgi:hypothetical protein
MLASPANPIITCFQLNYPAKVWCPPSIAPGLGHSMPSRPPWCSLGDCTTTEADFLECWPVRLGEVTAAGRPDAVAVCIDRRHTDGELLENNPVGLAEVETALPSDLVDCCLRP